MANPNSQKTVLHIESNGNVYDIPYQSKNAALKALRDWQKQSGVKGKIVVSA
jgi:hypothetical protein